MRQEFFLCSGKMGFSSALGYFVKSLVIYILLYSIAYNKYSYGFWLLQVRRHLNARYV